MTMNSNMTKRMVLFLAVAVSVVFFSVIAFSEGRNKQVLVITVDGVINPVASEFIGKSIKMADEIEAEALVIKLDTPGGLDTSMRTIVKDIIGSRVPIVVFVAPGGARAASAGVFITLAAHVAAMAPGTNIGAAHPVSVSGKMDENMAEKVTNDAAAYIRSLAERNGRNAAWAEEAVRKSISATESEALEKNVIDLISKDLKTLLVDIDGMEVTVSTGKRSLDTSGAVIIAKEMGVRYRILNFISDPNIAYMLMLLGFYGLFFELTNPGAIFPGVTGAICLVLAFYSFQTLPVNYAGVLLVVLGLIMFILEIKVISYGALTIGGIISMVMGSLMLFDSPSPFFRISIYLILPTVIVTALFFSVVVGLVFKAQKRKPVTGADGLIGFEGIANTDITKDGGMISLHGELWSAYSDETILKGERVIIEAVNGLKIKARKA